MIRQFVQSDMEQVLKIWLEASIQAHDFIDKRFWESNVDAMRDIYLPSAETIVYEINNEICGFASYFDHNLAALFISPEMQNRGIGTELLNEVKKKCHKLQLSVYKENRRGVAFYTKNGFAILREQTDANTEHRELVMICR